MTKKYLETLILNIPDYNFLENNEEILPIGWFFNYSNLFEVPI